MKQNKKVVQKKRKQTSVIRGRQFVTLLAVTSLLVLFVVYGAWRQRGAGDISSFRARPYNIVKPLVKPYAKPQQLVTPANVKTAYNLNTSNLGSGTIAIVDAYDDPNIESDLGVFNAQFGLPVCTTANGCFEKHKMATNVAVSPDWAIEIALDVQWAHAVAPGAKILLVEAKSDSGTDLLAAVNYARSRKDVVAVSMSWGGGEFSSEVNYENYFTSSTGAVFFAASGDNGNGTSWPAVSANVISVGGTKVNLNTNGSFASEVAWSGSGGGLSRYIREPARQTSYGVPRATSRRATPDVAYNADPNSGYPVYDSISYSGSTGWFQVGGTSAGSPQWAAIASLSAGTLNANKLYADAKLTNQTTFRDIINGTNGNCGFFCSSSKGYDYVTGLGSPLSNRF